MASCAERAGRSAEEVQRVCSGRVRQAIKPPCNPPVMLLRGIEGRRSSPSVRAPKSPVCTVHLPRGASPNSLPVLPNPRANRVWECEGDVERLRRAKVWPGDRRRCELDDDPPGGALFAVVAKRGGAPTIGIRAGSSEARLVAVYGVRRRWR